MQIMMIGIDHEKASLKEREKFSFTSQQLEDAMVQIYREEEVTGVIIISTCNRTELWMTSENSFPDGIELLCRIKEIDFEEGKKAAVVREGKDAVFHLMMTACGINSRVFGEDQIISQIKDALDNGRRLKTAGKTLEKVFSNSIAAAKKVKTSVKLTSHNPSVADSGVRELKEICGSLQGKKCLIIGNGKMAALIGEHLVENGADVIMTLRRKYHAGEEGKSLIPDGCKMISYDDRYQALKDADFVISATLSPHYTICLDTLKNYKFKEPGFWLDLAVPRDIEPEIANEFDVTIFDIDSLGNRSIREHMSAEIRRAEEIIGTYRDDIMDWMDFRKLLPNIQEIITATKRDAVLRADKEFRNLNLDEKTIIEIEKIMESAAGRAINKLMFGLRETLPSEYREAAIAALLESSRKDTMKR